ncbi:hypothetical protein pipiens_000127, partial [Culex pipiens pipiens]
MVTHSEVDHTENLLKTNKLLQLDGTTPIFGDIARCYATTAEFRFHLRPLSGHRRLRPFLPHIITNMLNHSNWK